MTKNKTFAEKLKDWRKGMAKAVGHEFTQIDAILLLGRPMGTYRHWEQGSATPHPLIQTVILARMGKTLKDARVGKIQ